MLQPSKNKSRLLYDAVSKDYDIGTYEEFSAKLQNPEKRKSFYEGVGEEYDLGTYEEFESKVSQSKKKVSSVSPKQQAPKAATTESPSADGSLATPRTKEDEEEDYFKGSFGKVLKGIDAIAPIGIGDFIDDMARSAASGYRQGQSDEESFNLAFKGQKGSYKEIQKFIDAKKNAQQLKPSAEFQDYNRIYEEEGKGFWGVVKGFANNPSILPELILSSAIGMATNSDALTAAGATIGTGATGGAIAGAVATPEFLGAGAIPGAITGATSAIPYAFGAASTVVETGATFAELLTEELKGKELTKENVKAILEDPEKYKSIRNKAIARGLVIGTLDALTGKLAGGVGAKIVSKSAAKSAVGAASKKAITKSVAAGSAIEAVGGSAGEAAARLAIGQDMDVSEIALEGLAELPGGIRSTIQARLAKPSYEVNGEKVKAEEIDELINTMTPEQLAVTDIKIKNDYQGREFKLRDKVLTNSIKEDVRKANPELNEPSLNAITELEKQLQTLEGNKTQTGKDKAAAIRTQIKDIQENQLKEETDAIQEQATDESVLRTEQPELGLQEMGQGDAQGEVVTEQATQEVTPSEIITTAQPQEVADIEKKRAETEAKIKRKDLFTGVGEFSTELGNSDKAAVPVSHNETNGIEFVEYAHPDTGSVDVIVSGKSDNDFVGFYRIYENGKPTNKWSSKFENKSRNKEDFKTMISGVQELLPEGHQYTEKTSISTDGLRVWNQQLDKGYELQYDENGNIVTNTVAINGDAIVNELGVDVNKGNFENIKITKEQFETVKKALLPYLEKLGLNESNIRYTGEKVTAPGAKSSVQIDLPILVKSAKSKTEEVTPSQTITTDEISQPIELSVPSATATQPEEVKGTFLDNILDKIYEYTDPITGGKLKGNVFFDGQEVVFTDGNKEFSLGTVQDALSNNSLNATEVTPTFNISEDGTIDILQETEGIPKGKITPQGAGLKAIKTDKNGNVKRVVITDANGVTHSVKGELANELADFMMLDLAKKGGLIRKINSDETTRETFNRGVREASAKRKSKDTQTGVQRLDGGRRVEETPTPETVTEVVTEPTPVVEAPMVESKIYYQGIPKGSNYMQAIIDENGETLFQGSLEGVEKFKKDNGIPSDKVSMIDLDTSNPNSLISKILKEKTKPTEVQAKAEPTPVVETESILEEAPVAKPKQTKAEQIISEIDKAIQALFDKNGPDIETWATGPDNSNLIALKRAKKALQTDNKTFKTFLDTPMGKRYSDIAVKFEDTAEVDKIKADIEVSKERLKKAWDKYKNMGIAFDPESNLARDRELVKSLVLYAYNNVRLGSYEASKLIKDLAEQGFEITRDGANFIMDKAFKKVQKEVNKTAGVKPKPTEQKRINKAFAVGIATQRVVTDAVKADVKDLKGQVVDVFRAGIEAVKIAQTTAKEKARDIKIKSEELAKYLDELKGKGRITANQASSMVKRFSKVNVLSEKSVNRFIDYATKVLNDADYSSKLTEARKTLSSIKKLSKNADKNPDLRAVGIEFSKIEPSMLENIEDYNDIASKLETAIDGSKIRGKNTNIVDTVNIDEVSSYIEKTLAEQEKKLQQEKIDEIQDLFGVDASEFSAEEIDALLESDKDLSKDNEKVVRAAIKKAFDIYSTVIKDMLETKIDSFTGEDVEFTKQEQELIERFMNIDPNTIKDPKEALRTVDSLINFIQNKSTAGMLKPIADNDAIVGGKEAVRQGLISKKLRKYWIPSVGRFFGEKTTTLPVLFEKMFKGVTRALKVEELIGMSDLINNSSKAEGESNTIAKEYVKLFYNKKANGEAYNSSYNDIERGIFAHVNRSVIGTNERVKKVFDKRKQEVLDAIKLLNDKGNDSESEIAKLLEKAYDKVLDGSENIDDVRKKTDINNVNGVEFWVNKWSDKFNALSDLALNFYNKKLQRDIGYTPDRVRKLQDKTEDVDLDDMQSQFFTNTDEILYDKKSGSLMDKQENRNVPKDMYIDFSFDKKNTNAMYDALTDLYTAYDIRKVGSFLKSDNFRKIFPSKKDANLIDKRIKKFVRLTRRKMPYSDSETSNILKFADKIAKIGVSSALASPAQPFKQTIPVMVSTLVNAGNLGMGANLDSKFNDWLNGLGYAISNRGAEAQVEINSINKMIEDSASMQKGKALKRLEKLNDKLLKVTLVYWDVMVARASFKAYYEQSLKKQGEKSSNINYSKHEVNKEAANYAQRMVDRQQNISNPALAGDLYTSKENSTKVLVKMLAPFSSFRTNQGARLASDLTTLEYWNTSTKADKVIAARSIAGYALEATTFRAIQIGYSILLYNIAQAVLGKYDDEDEEKFTKNLVKGSAISSFTDTFSPIPFGDPFLQDFTAEAFETGQSLLDIPEDKRIEIFKSREQSAVKILGTYGIPIERANEIYELGKLAYTKEYIDDYGNKKEISDKDAEALKIMITPLVASSVVIGPDVANVTRRMVKMAKQGKVISQEELIKRQEKIDALNKVIDKSNDRDVESAARQMINEMKETDPNKLRDIEERKKEMKEMKESLLIDPRTGIEYDNPSELKKYNEPLWEKNFGERSEWYKENQGEAEAKSLMNKIRKGEEEEEYNYIPKKKRKGRFGMDRYRR